VDLQQLLAIDAALQLQSNFGKNFRAVAQAAALNSSSGNPFNFAVLPSA
jgi:hypothetical protein